MKKIMKAMLAVALCATAAFPQTNGGSSGELTQEEFARLDYIVRKLREFQNTALPIMRQDIKHFNELHHMNVNISNYVEAFHKVYPRTSKYVEEQFLKINGTGAGKSVTAASGGPGGGAWTRFSQIMFAVSIYAWSNSEMEQNFYNDLIDRGIDPELAQKEANYQSDRCASVDAGFTGGILVAIAEAMELFTEANDNSRYTLNEYALRTLAGPDRQLEPRARYPISVGGDGAMIIGTPGPGGGCVIIGPGAMPNSGPPGTDLPTFQDEITVIGKPLAPC